jgi:hypothetical protein
MLIPARTGAAAVARNDSTPWTARISTEAWLAAGLTLAGAALRFATLTSQSYWFDEAQAAHELHLSLGTMLSLWSANEPNPPLYFLLAWPWAHLFGTGEAGLRSLSAIFGTAVIPIAYLCGRELVSRRAGLCAAALAALNPFMIWYSQEAREYMLLVALSGASLLFFARAWRAPSRRRLAWWAVFSGLALLTQYFAAFLVAAEAIALVLRGRNRATLVAVGAMAVLELTLLPHFLGHVSHPAGWIAAVPLSTRIQQLPIAFGLNTLYLSTSPLVSYGLLGAAVLAGCLIALLVIGADPAQLRGAGLAAGVAATVLLAPLLLALLGHDYYEARALSPAWIPLAVVIGAACTARRTRLAGAALAFVLLALFVYAGIRIDGNSMYQRQDWRGVAAALGTPAGTRAIVAYDGTFATAPLAIYLPGVPWTGSAQMPQTSQTPVSVGEVDVVGGVWQKVPATLPPGTRLIGARTVDGYAVDRFALTHAWHLAPAAIAARAAGLLGPASPGGAVLIQYGSA